LLAVLSIQRLGGHLDVVQAQAEGEHELPEGRGTDPPAAQRLQRPRPRIVDPGETALRDLLPISRLRQLEILEPQDPEVDEPRTTFDLEDVPDSGLHEVLHHEVLAAEDVRDPKQRVVDGPRELEHRPDAVPRADPWMLPHRDAEQDAVTERGIRMGHVRLEADDGFAFTVLAGEHRLPHRDRLVDVLDAVHARAHRFAVLPQGLRVALTRLGLAGREELLGPLVMQRDPVALVQDLVVLDAGPADALLHRLERFGAVWLVS